MTINNYYNNMRPVSYTLTTVIDVKVLQLQLVSWDISFMRYVHIYFESTAWLHDHFCFIYSIYLVLYILVLLCIPYNFPYISPDKMTSDKSSNWDNDLVINALSLNATCKILNILLLLEACAILEFLRLNL